MGEFIVITSVYSPSRAVKEFAAKEDYSLVVVADKKTPTDWELKNTHFLSVAAQTKLGFELARSLPFNHYARKMIGYLYAIQEGATNIVDTDDDNLPKDDWGFPRFEGNFECIEENSGFVNIYNYFTQQKIWPRGFPLSRLNEKVVPRTVLRSCRIGVWQGLADEDPDVDAIYRLVFDQPCYFIERDPIVLLENSTCPFNSQNTIIRRELFPLLYLPAHVSFRFTDILRSLVAQPIMWLNGYYLGFTKPTVVQIRNPHNFMRDFQSEVPMYLNTEKICDIVRSSVSAINSIEENLLSAYQALASEKILPENEVHLLYSWLNDIGRLLKT